MAKEKYTDLPVTGSSQTSALLTASLAAPPATICRNRMEWGRNTRRAKATPPPAKREEGAGSNPSWPPQAQVDVSDTTTAAMPAPAASDLEGMSKDDLIKMLLGQQSSSQSAVQPPPQVPPPTKKPSLDSPVLDPPRPRLRRELPKGEGPNGELTAEQRACWVLDGPDDPPLPPAPEIQYAPLPSEPSEVAKALVNIKENKVSNWDQPGISISDELLPQLAEALRANSTIQILGMHQMELEDRHAQALLNGGGMFPKVQYLSLYENDFGNGGMSAIAQAVNKGAFEKLEVLGMNNCQVVGPPNGQPFDFAECLKKGKLAKLRQVYLMGNPLNEAARAALKAACESRKVSLWMDGYP